MYFLVLAEQLQIGQELHKHVELPTQLPGRIRSVLFATHSIARRLHLPHRHAPLLHPPHSELVAYKRQCSSEVRRNSSETRSGHATTVPTSHRAVNSPYPIS